MEAKDVLKELRQRHNMTQDQLSEKLAVTRQAGFPLGKRRVRPQPGNIKAVVRTV